MTRHTPLKGADREAVANDLAELYEAGSSIRGLVERTGRGYGAVHALLLEAGVTLRSRGAGIRKAGA